MKFLTHFFNNRTAALGRFDPYGERSKSVTSGHLNNP